MYPAFLPHQTLQYKPTYQPHQPISKPLKTSPIPTQPKAKPPSSSPFKISTTTAPQPTGETLVRTATTFIHSYNTLSIPTILSIRTPTCIHHTLPLSLSIPSRTNTELITFLTPMFKTILKSIQFKIMDEEETVVDIERRMVVIHCSNTAETVVERYENEYVIRLGMSEDGELVDGVWEWAGGERMGEFMGRVREFLEKKGEEGGDE